MEAISSSRNPIVAVAVVAVAKGLFFSFKSMIQIIQPSPHSKKRGIIGARDNCKE